MPTLSSKWAPSTLIVLPAFIELLAMEMLSPWLPTEETLELTLLVAASVGEVVKKASAMRLTKLSKAIFLTGSNLITCFGFFIRQFGSSVR